LIAGFFGGRVFYLEFGEALSAATAAEALRSPNPAGYVGPRAVMEAMNPTISGIPICSNWDCDGPYFRGLPVYGRNTLNA
jgi:hypothetical protein